MGGSTRSLLNPVAHHMSNGFTVNSRWQLQAGNKRAPLGAAAGQLGRSRGVILVLVACLSASFGFMAGSFRVQVGSQTDRHPQLRVIGSWQNQLVWRTRLAPTNQDGLGNSVVQSSIFQGAGSAGQLPIQRDQSAAAAAAAAAAGVRQRPGNPVNVASQQQSASIPQRRHIPANTSLPTAAEELFSESFDAENDPLIRHKMVNQEELHNLLTGMVAGQPIVGTIANSAFKEMLFNWLAHVRQANMKNVLVASLDEDLYKECVAKGVDSILLHSNMPTKDFRRDGKTFKNMGSLKTGFVLSIVEQGWDVLMSDTDVAWLADPWEVVRSEAAMGGADILISSDSVSVSNDVESMKKDPTIFVKHDWQGWFRYATGRAKEIFGNVYEHAFNTGVLYLRATRITVEFCTAWHDIMRTKGKIRGWEKVWGDQHALNQLMRISMFPIRVVEATESRPRHNRVFWAFNHTLQLGILPPGQFCNGHVFFVQKTPQRAGLKVYMVHNTFQYYYGGGKITRFREAGLWMLDPDKYYTEGNFLSFEVEAPKRIVDMPDGIGRHQAAIHYYYEATRNALALAKILNRTLILPKLQCYCDRWWDRLSAPCRAPGGDVDPPFTCPMDHVVNTFFWGHDGATLKYRHSTFLESPRLAPEIAKSRLVVRLEGAPGAADGHSPEAPMRLRLNSSDREAWQALQGLSATRVLHLPNTADAFCRYEEHQDNRAFDRSTWMMFYIEWCCTSDGKRVNMTVPPFVNRTFESCGRTGPLHAAR